jgi:hypothetical protein
MIRPSPFELAVLVLFVALAAVAAPSWLAWLR